MCSRNVSIFTNAIKDTEPKQRFISLVKYHDEHISSHLFNIAYVLLIFYYNFSQAEKFLIPSVLDVCQFDYEINTYAQSNIYSIKYNL